MPPHSISPLYSTSRYLETGRKWATPQNPIPTKPGPWYDFCGPNSFAFYWGPLHRIIHLQVSPQVMRVVAAPTPVRSLNQGFPPMPTIHLQNFLVYEGVPLLHVTVCHRQELFRITKCSPFLYSLLGLKKMLLSNNLVSQTGQTCFVAS